MDEYGSNEELRGKIEDLIRQYMERQHTVRYCQRCENPRSEAEFMPGAPRGVCLHCLKAMDPRELRWLEEHQRL